MANNYEPYAHDLERFGTRVIPPSDSALQTIMGDEPYGVYVNPKGINIHMPFYSADKSINGSLRAIDPLFSVTFAGDSAVLRLSPGSWEALGLGPKRKPVGNPATPATKDFG